MLRNKSWQGIFAAAAAVLFGMLAVGCGTDDNPSGGGTPWSIETWVAENGELAQNNGSFEMKTLTQANDDSELNGTWVTEDGELTLNNGSFEMKALIPEYDDDWEEIIDTMSVRAMKGTFTTSGSAFTLTPTHIHGDLFNAELGLGELGDEFLITSAWYTKDELKTEFKKVFGALVYAMMGGDEMIDEMFSELTTPQVGTYVLSGNSLTLAFDDGDTQTFTREGSLSVAHPLRRALPGRSFLLGSGRLGRYPGFYNAVNAAAR